MILALVAMLAVAGTALADSRFDLESNATNTIGQRPTTTDNDDSCDIGTAPAATLLLPYFEVNGNVAAGTGQTTLFTITNVSRYPQIAHITVWTDWSFPVLDFNVFLTGFDVQSLDLYDVLVNNRVAPGTGPGPGTSSTSKTITPQGGAGTRTDIVPVANNGNPNLVASAVGAGGSCSALPGTLPPTLMEAVRSALTTGEYNVAGTAVQCDPDTVGGVHSNMIGYVTVDVVSLCSIRLPDDPTYIATELLFDNVLIGDYQHVDGSPAVGNFALGNPMVHIRAIPEGGPSGVLNNPGTFLPYTFMDRYTFGAPGNGIPTRTFDRRQPLPSTFAARWIQGGSGAMNTNYKIWREGYTAGPQSCDGAIENANMPVAEIVRFDDIENAYGFGQQQICSPCPPGVGPSLPETSSTSTTSAVYPPLTGSRIDGWMYINANNFGDPEYSASRAGFAPAGSGTTVRASQNWVTISMFAQGRYGVEFDAAWLGNGCSPAAVDPATSSSIGPAGGTLVCPTGIAGCTPGVGAYTGTNSTP